MKLDDANSSPGGDAFGVLGWGLRRYWWLILLGVLALGVVSPALFVDEADRYDAQAQVGPTDRLTVPNTDLLPRIGESLFNNGAVSEAVRKSFIPTLSRSTSVIPERAELLVAQDNLILTVVGHGDTPESAQTSANVAAATFAQELNQYTRSVGSFAVQQVAEMPSTPEPTMSRSTAIGLGMLAGLFAGLAMVVALLAWRRPVVDTSTASRVAGAPVLARLNLGGQQSEITGLPLLCRRLLSADIDVVLLTGPKATAQMRHHLAEELAGVLRGVRSVRLVRGGELHPSAPPLAPHASARGSADDRDRTATATATATRDLVIVDEPTQIEVATRRPDDSIILLLVREGIGQATLGSSAEQYLDSGNSGIVLARGRRWDAQRWLRRAGR